MSVHGAIAEVSLLSTARDRSGRLGVADRFNMQLKSSFTVARRSEVTANVKLHERPTACILWIFFDPDTLSLGMMPSGEKNTPRWHLPQRLDV
jgi:hypothetical protein